MSSGLRCDVCDTNRGNWNLRKQKKFKFFEKRGYGDYEWIVELDICDDCLKKFIKYVNDKGRICCRCGHKSDLPEVKEQ